MQAYPKDHFWLKSPAEKFTYQMIGKELEAGITFVYLQVTGIPAVKELQVSNTVFFDRFGDQSNIINVEINNNLQSAFLDRANPVKTLHFD
ncbi:MAG: DUF6702 family protein [Owenweeksia sp.]|nr:DUF6702 family protein [Owenweeksia sp.]